MALEKRIQNAGTGHYNNYWRITRISIDAQNAMAVIVLSGYADADARTEGRQPDDSRTFSLTLAQFMSLASVQVSGGTMFEVVAEASYSYIKSIANGEFSDAIDVL